MSNTKAKNKLFKSFEKISNQYGFIKHNIFPWYTQEMESMKNTLIFTFGKYDVVQFSFMSRIHSIEEIWEEYFFTLNPTQKNKPYTIYSHLSTIPKYFPELITQEELIVDFKEEQLIENFEVNIHSIIKNTLIPFFNEVGKNEKLDEIINTPVSNYVNVLDLFAGGRDILFKKLILAKLCKSKKTQEVFEFANNKYQAEIEKNHQIDNAKLKIKILNEILNEKYSEDEI